MKNSLKTPEFWYKNSSAMSEVLTPISWLYQQIHKTNRKTKKTYKSGIPVICVGGAVAGGSGKTPCAIALYRLIKQADRFRNISFLTRGYGGNIKTPTIVAPKKHSFCDVGDEALILANTATTIVSPNRKAGAKLAEKNGHDLIIMDDGLQNFQLHKDVTFLVIDGKTGFGNKKTIPSGPLREPLEEIFSKTDAFIIMGQKDNINTDLQNLPENKGKFFAQLKPEKTGLTGQYIAFAGIGLPDKFKTTLENMNAKIIEFHPFPDHYPYQPKDIERLKILAKRHNAKLMTTQKDYTRIPSQYIKDITYLPVTVEFSTPEKIIETIDEII